MIRVDEETGLGVSVATDCNGRFAKLDPYAGAQLALAEAYRNVATGGASPLAVSDCLNFGSPEDPAVMWQFAEACRGLKDGCIELGIPVTGGNVSLYNQTGETAILPTPVVAVLGVMDDVRRRTPSAFGAEGDAVYLLGETRAELSGSEWAHVVHGHLGGLPPVVDLQAERALASLLHDGVGLLTSAHDLSEGGLAQALAEAVTAPRRRRDRGRRRGRVRRAVLRVRRPLPGHGPPRPGRGPRGDGRRPRRTPSAGSVPPAATPSPSTATSPSPSTSSVPPGRAPSPLRWGSPVHSTGQKPLATTQTHGSTSPPSTMRL